MVIIGVDAHKRTHTLVAIDGSGVKLADKTVAATADGHLDVLGWASQWPERSFALEDCRHLTRRLEGDLLRSGEAVVRVPTRLMAGQRRSSRQPGKSDPIDALSVARAALREPNLPVARLDGESRRLRFLVDHRDDLVGERTRIQCRLRWHLHELALEGEVPPSSLRRFKVLDRLDEQLSPIEGTVAELARELVGRTRELTVRINELEHEIGAITKLIAPGLLALPGCGVLSAAKIVAETAGARRFRSKAAFARWNGTAPIPVWSSNTERFRLNRGGNRQVNAALHRIGVTQWRGVGPGRAYVQARMAAGNTKTEALRALRRRLSDAVFRLLVADEIAREGGLASAEHVAA